VRRQAKPEGRKSLVLSGFRKIFTITKTRDATTIWELRPQKNPENSLRGEYARARSGGLHNNWFIWLWMSCTLLLAKGIEFLVFD
jgi:hypothetical protein